MRLKYLYQQIASHISVIVIAFIVLTLVFSQFAEQFVYGNKADELLTYGQSILGELDERQQGSEKVLQEYGRVLSSREIQFSLFDEDSAIIYSQGRGPVVELKSEEWKKIRSGEAVIVNQDFKRFQGGVTFVLLPYFHQGQFVGGILLASPIKGSSELVSQINQYLFYTMLIALGAAILLSWILSKFHVRRIKDLQQATSLVAGGDYSVQIPSSEFDEIGELAGDFNQMVGKLEQSREEIESLENRRRQFMADVSHELRTPLTTISGVLEGMQSGMISEEAKKRAVGLADKEARRLIRLVNENLDYEKIRSNQVKLNKEDISLIEVFEVVKEQLAGAAGEKGNRIEIEAEQEVRIWADYDRLMQILINIVKNSIQFTENGVIRLTGRMSGGETVIEISDTGIGIDPEEIEKIWGRFYKALISRTNNPYGESGLGLSIVKQLTTLHHGTIRVTSQPGKGTRFILTFPNRGPKPGSQTGV